MRIDLNCDMGESFGRWTLGDDEAIIPYLSSANIACGYHAGDATVMRKTVALAAKHGVTIGAHVSYRDIAGFGRRFIDYAPSQLVDDIVYQIGALKTIAQVEGATVGYVKPHGALGNAIFWHKEQAAAVVQAQLEVSIELPLLTTAGAVAIQIAKEKGLVAYGEAFADRAYNSDGSLVDRKLPGAVLHDPAEISNRVLAMIQTGKITAIDGTKIPFTASSICLHGDSDGAANLAKVIRTTLDSSGVTVTTFLNQ